MALIADLVTRLGIDDSRFNKGMKNARASVNSFVKYSIGAVSGLAFAFYKVTESVGQLYDNTQKIGVGVKKFQELAYAADKAGLSADGLQNILAKMQMSLGAAFAGDKGKNSILDSLGLSLTELSKLSPDQQFLKIASALGQVKDRTQQVYAAQQLLGEGFKEAAGLINSNIDGTIQKYKDLKLGLTQAQAEAVDSFGESSHLIGTIFNDLFQKIVAGVSPTFEKFTDAIANAIEEMGGLDKVAESFSKSLINGLSAGANALNEIYRTMVAIRILDTERELRVASLANPAGGNQQLSADQIRQITYNPRSGKPFDPRALQYSYLPSISSVMQTQPLQNDLNKLYGQYNGATKVGQQITEGGSQTSLVPVQIIDVGKASDKASKSIQMLGDSAEKTKNMFQNAFDSNTGTSDQISRILNGADLPQTVIDEDFDRLASSILSEFRRGGNANGASIQTNLSVLGKWAEQNSINGDNTAQLNAFKELQKYINKESDKQKVEITFIPSKYGYIEWANSPEGRKYAKEGAQQMAADGARGVRN